MSEHTVKCGCGAQSAMLIPEHLNADMTFTEEGFEKLWHRGCFAMTTRRFYQEINGKKYPYNYTQSFGEPFEGAYCFDEKESDSSEFAPDAPNRVYGIHQPLFVALVATCFVVCMGISYWLAVELANIINMERL